MKIRPASPSEFKDIAALQARSWKDAYARDLPANFIDGQLEPVLKTYWKEIKLQTEDLVLVAEQDGLAGFIAVWCRPAPFIDHLHVRPDLRSRNIGADLMAAVSGVLVQNGHQTAYLWVFDSNHRAIRFYERLGGVQKEQALKSVFGHQVLSRKVVWEDVALMAG